MITIGLDPHPDSHTVAALDENGTTLASLTVSNDAEGLARLHQFTLPFPKRRWAVEGAANRFILPFVCELLEGTDLKDVSEHSSFDTGEFDGSGTFGLCIGSRSENLVGRMPCGRYALLTGVSRAFDDFGAFLTGLMGVAILLDHSRTPAEL